MEIHLRMYILNYNYSFRWTVPLRPMPGYSLESNYCKMHTWRTEEFQDPSHLALFNHHLANMQEKPQTTKPDFRINISGARVVIMKDHWYGPSEREGAEIPDMPLLRKLQCSSLSLSVVSPTPPLCPSPPFLSSPSISLTTTLVQKRPEEQGNSGGGSVGVWVAWPI